MLTSNTLITTALMARVSQYSSSVKRLHALLQDVNSNEEIDMYYNNFIITSQVPPALLETCMDWVASVNELSPDRLRMLAVINLIINTMSKLNLLDEHFVEEGAAFSRDISKLDFTKFEYVFESITEDNWDDKNITPQELTVVYEYAPLLAECYSILIERVRKDDARQLN